jgi:hypothetical protein
MERLSPRDSNQTASGKPGAVHAAGIVDTEMSCFMEPAAAQPLATDAKLTASKR